MSLPFLNGKECIVGWRGFGIYEPGLFVTTSTVWLPGERVEATCTIREHREEEVVPVEGCTCGLYSFKTPYKLRTDNYLNQMVFAEVYYWGRVIECTMGYRAQFAYPKKIYMPDENTHKLFDQKRQWENKRRILEYVAYRYEVDFEIIDGSHPIYTKTQKELEEEARQRAIDAAERARRAMGTRAFNAALRKKAEATPSQYPHLYKNLWEQIVAEADIKTRAKLEGK